MKVELKGVSKSFKQHKVLKDINVKFNPGKICGIVGTNGSGKSVLLKIICGIMIPDSGKVLFDGEESLRLYGVPKSTRALIEHPEFINSLSGFENLKLIASIQNTIDDKRIMEVLHQVGLEGDEQKKYREYSLGMKQKLGIAQVIMEDSDLLILDEPLNGLDEKSTSKIRNILKDLKKQGKIIIISTHIKDDIKLLIDELYKIEDGKLLKYDK